MSIIDLGRQREPLHVRQVLPVTTDQYPTAARRPQFSVLDCSKIEGVFGIIPSQWATGLREMCVELYGDGKFS